MPKPFRVNAKVQMNSMEFGVVGSMSCRDGYVASFQNALYNSITDMLIRNKHSSDRINTAIYHEMVPVALLLLHHENARVHIELDVQSNHSFDISSQYIDSLVSRYPGVDITVTAEQDPFSGERHRKYIFDGNLSAIAASWWMILIDRDATYSQKYEIFPKLMVLANEYYVDSFTNLWENATLEPSVWKWLVNGYGPLLTSGYFGSGDEEPELSLIHI